MMARTIKATVGKNNLKDKMKSTTNLLSRLRHVAQVSDLDQIYTFCSYGISGTDKENVICNIYVY